MSQPLKDGGAAKAGGRPRLQLAETFAAVGNRHAAKLPAKADGKRAAGALALADVNTPTVWPEGEATFLLPTQVINTWIGPIIALAVVVIVPLVVLAIYLFGFAAPQYQAEFRFSVTEVQTPNSGGSTTPDPAAGPGGMMAMASAALGGGGVHSGSQQNYVVIDYIKSRQVIEELSKRMSLEEIYSRPAIDWWMRFDPEKSRERLLDYWSSMVTTTYDPMTGLAKVEVVAFTPQDAYKIAEALVELSEALVNDISGRSRADAVRFAENEVARARAELEQRRADLAAFRVKEGVIDPTPGAVTTNIQVGAALQTTLAQLQADFATLKQQNIDERSPASQSVLARINATKQQLQGVEREVANDRVGRDTLARVVAQYDRFEVERQYAQSTVLTALQTLDRARTNAAAQHLYLTPYVRPAMPTSAAGPAIAKTMTLACLGLFGLWLVGILLVRSIRQSAA